MALQRHHADRLLAMLDERKERAWLSQSRHDACAAISQTCRFAGMRLRTARMMLLGFFHVCAGKLCAVHCHGCGRNFCVTELHHRTVQDERNSEEQGT
jgi:hypothetical protein